MREEDFDQRPGAGLVAVAAPYGVPESLMGLGERPCLSCLDQGSRSQHRTGFVGQDLEIMVQGQRFGAFVQRPWVACHDGGTVNDFEMRGPETDPYLLSDALDRHRVVGLTHTDP